MTFKTLTLFAMAAFMATSYAAPVDFYAKPTKRGFENIRCSDPYLATTFECTMNVNGNPNDVNWWGGSSAPGGYGAAQGEQGGFGQGGVVYGGGVAAGGVGQGGSSNTGSGGHGTPGYSDGVNAYGGAGHGEPAYGY